MNAFQYAKNSGNFVRKCNGKVRFDSVRMECSEPSLQAVHIDQSDRPKTVCRFILTNQFVSLYPLSRFKTPFHLGGRLAKGKETVRAISLS